MSLDRNANDALRLRRNAQRFRAGDGTNSIKVATKSSPGILMSLTDQSFYGTTTGLDDDDNIVWSLDNAGDASFFSLLVQGTALVEGGAFAVGPDSMTTSFLVDPIAGYGEFYVPVIIDSDVSVAGPSLQLLTGASGSPDAAMTIGNSTDGPVTTFGADGSAVFTNNVAVNVPDADAAFDGIQITSHPTGASFINLNANGSVQTPTWSIDATGSGTFAGVVGGTASFSGALAADSVSVGGGVGGFFNDGSISALNWSIDASGSAFFGNGVAGLLASNLSLASKGDLVTTPDGTALSALSVGSDGQVLTADSTQTTGLKWAASGSLSVTTKGDLQTFSTVAARLPVGSNGQVLSADSTQATGLKWVGAAAGTVTSVDLTVPSFLSVTGNPVTGSGTLAVSLATQTKNTFFAGPATGSAAAPTFRAIGAADLGATTKGDLLTFDTGLNRLGVGSDGQVLTADSTQSTGIKWAAPGGEFINASNVLVSTPYASYPLHVHRPSTASLQQTGIGFTVANTNLTQTPTAAIIVQGGGSNGQVSSFGIYGHTAAATAGSLTQFMGFDASGNATMGGSLNATVAGTVLTQTNAGVSANVGSMLFVNTAASSAVTAATDTNFNKSFTLPVNFFQVGKTIRVKGMISYNSDLASTVTFQLKYGSVSLDSRTLTPVTNGTGLRAYFDMTLTCFSIGASGTVMRMGSFMGEQNASNPAADIVTPIGGGTATIATNASNAIQFSGAFSATSATNTASLLHMTVEALN